MRHILHVVGARPNFMKVAPVRRALEGRARQTLVHTGQHYDASMSGIFFSQLGIPEPDVNLEVGSGTHAEQTGTTMIRLEKLFGDERPDLVLVYGDVNSTAAAALVCAKMGIAIGHVEAGLRSRDRSMPEEINRLVTDALADLLFTPSEDGNRNLAAEGVPPDRVFLVGNVMIDTLIRLLPQADGPSTRAKLGLGQRYGLVTLHRPSNVDHEDSLRALMGALADIARTLPIVFPVHPRTRAKLGSLGVTVPPALSLVEPLGYLEFLALQRDAVLVITDSGGVQEETTFLNVPCLTMRDTTERPVTVTLGSNILIGQDTALLRSEVQRVLDGDAKRGSIPPLWDGQAGRRIAELIP
jgi:UDP-N-acetylglucosamine 2-epimerase (non-hydrolysing)